MPRWFTVVAVAAIGCHVGPSPSAPPPHGVTDAPIEVARGAYVARLGGCKVCHVPGGGPQHAPNITPDVQTGIGSWSDAQVIAAVRQGVLPSGARLAPVMPYPSFHAMTDSDAHALVRYLRVQQPRHDRIAREPSPLPPIALPPAFCNVDPVSDRVRHGEYLAALMHCAGCHGAQYAGGQRFGDVVAANITSDVATGIGTWSEDDIVHAIKHMEDPKGEPIQGPMACYQAGWAKLTDTDLYSLAAFVKSLPPVIHDVTSEPSGVASRP